MSARIQRKRTKGWRMPPGAVYVGRPTKWGNPFAVGEVVDDDLLPFVHEMFPATRNLTRLRLYSHAGAAALYDRWIIEVPALMLSVRDELEGRDLACWCPLLDNVGLPRPCHADVLLELANR